MRFVFVALLLAGAGSMAAEKPKLVVSPDVQVSNDGEFAHVETMNAAHPTDARVLLSSAIIHPGGEQTCRVYGSRDGGRTWAHADLPEKKLGDPIVAFGAKGTAYFACLLGNHNVGVFRSEDGGATWLPGVDLKQWADHEMIAVDTSAGKFAGRVYIGAQHRGDIQVYRSEDDARSFKSAVAVPKFSGGFVDNMLVLGDGTLFVPFRTKTEFGKEEITATVSCVTSTDGGETFSPPTKICVDLGRYKAVGGSVPVFACGKWKDGERIYCALSQVPAALKGRVNLAWSDDKGKTWSAPKEMLPDAGAESIHGFCGIIVNKDGVVGIAWLEVRVKDPNRPEQVFKKGEKPMLEFNETYDVWFTASVDGGENFLPPVKVSTKTSDPKSRHAGRFSAGTDYMFMCADAGGAFQLLWPDARNGIFQLYAAQVKIEK